MKKITGDNFCSDVKYKLYRSVYEIIHPSISKKNISNYKVVFDEKLLPVLVFYPKRLSDINSVIIFIPGDGKVSGSYGEYSKICKRLAKESKKLVVAIDYFNNTIKYPTTVNKIYKVVKYLFEEFQKNGIGNEKIVLMGDSVGCSILGCLVSKMIAYKIHVEKMVMIYPVVRDDYSNYQWNDVYKGLNFNLDKKVNGYLKKFFLSNNGKKCNLLEKESLKLFPKTLIVTGDMDIFKDDGKKLALKFMKDVSGSRYCNIGFSNHGFLNSTDEEAIEKTYDAINNFLI